MIWNWLLKDIDIIILLNKHSYSLFRKKFAVLNQFKGVCYKSVYPDHSYLYWKLDFSCHKNIQHWTYWYGKSMGFDHLKLQYSQSSVWNVRGRANLRHGKDLLLTWIKRLYTYRRGKNAYMLCGLQISTIAYWNLFSPFWHIVCLEYSHMCHL